MNSEYTINSKSYWNWRYSNNWENFNGSSQTRFFAKLILDNIPPSILADISNNAFTCLDFGTAKGQLCDELSKLFSNSKITGYDISEEAIKQAKELYPYIKFQSSPFQSKVDKFDAIFCSNTLEHLLDWENYLQLFTEISQKYIIILIPFESEIFDEHVVSFDKNSFINTINGFTKIFDKIIDTNSSGFWNGKQELLIYKK